MCKRTSTVVIIVHALMLLLQGAAAAQAPASAEVAAATLPRLGLLPCTAKRFDAQTTTILDDLLVNAVAATGRFDVISAADINAMLGLEKMRDMVNCDSTSCMAELGGALGVNLLLSGTVSVLGDELIVSLTLIDIKKQHVAARHQVRVANHESLYAQAVQDAVSGLLGLSAPASETLPAPHTDSGAPAAVGVARPTPTAAGAPTMTSTAALITFESDADDPIGVFVRLPDGDERHCPEGVRREHPCMLELVPGRYTVLTKGGAAQRRVRFAEGRTTYQLKVGASRTGLITGGSLAAGGTVLLVVGVATLHDTSCAVDALDNACINGLALTSLIVGSVAAYAGLMVLFFAGVGDYDQSKIISEHGSNASWWPHFGFSLGNQTAVQAAWQF